MPIMPDIFSDPNVIINTKGTNVVKPVREAPPLLIGKITFALFLPLILYVVTLFTTIEIRHIFSFEQDWNLEFLLFLLIIMGIQMALVLFIVFQWQNHSYYLTTNYIQENRGILTKTDKMYDLKNVRNVSVRQGPLGRLLNYGDLIVESSAPEFHEVLILTGIPEPHQHEAFLRQFI